MAEDLKPADRALFERIVPGNTSHINFMDIRIGHSDLARLLDAAREEGCHSDVSAERAVAEEDCPNPKGCDYCAEFGCPRAPAVSADRPGREEPVDIISALQGLMDLWHKQAADAEEKAKPLRLARRPEWKLHDTRAALLYRVASDLKLTISSALHANPAPVKADTAGEDPFASLPRFMAAVPATPEGEERDA